jgi:tetratricopeptide (TPR) repeat protein
MEEEPFNIHLERGRLLFEQDRHALAEGELRLALAAEPEHAVAHVLLALCLLEQGKHEAAADEARQALRFAPEFAFAHYALARVAYRQEKLGEAKAALRDALRLDPAFVSAHALLASVLLDSGNAVAAVEAAERGLALDPNHAHASAVRTLALLRLGRTDDATDETREALRRDPQDTLAHAGHGWALLHAKKPAEALTHFREALRLDPTNEWAREGLVEALKARYWVYRQMLSFFLWMSRRGTHGQIAIIIGLLIVQQVLANVARNQPAARPFVEPALYLFIGFVLLTWLADPLFTLLLRLNRFGRLVLDDEERRQSGWFGAGFVAALVGFAVWPLPTLYTDVGPLWGVACILTLVPLAAIFRCPTGWRRGVMALYTAGMVATAVAMVVCFVVAQQQTRDADFQEWLGYVPNLFRCILYGGFGAGFLANGLIVLRR